MKEAVITALLKDDEALDNLSEASLEELSENFGEQFIANCIVPALLAEGEIVEEQDRRFIGDDVSGEAVRGLGRHQELTVKFRGHLYRIYLFYPSRFRSREGADYRRLATDLGDCPLQPPVIRSFSSVKE